MKKLLLAALALCASALLTAPPSFAARDGKVLNIYNWAEYMPNEVLKKFTKETGIKVNYSTFDSNETMYAKLKALQGKGYDIVVPSTYFVNRMRKEGMLKQLDKTLLTNFGNLDPKLLNQPYDPNNEYSVPYLWGSTGIAVNTRIIPPGEITKWADLWNPKFKNSILLLDDVRDVFSMALKVLGYSVNETDEGHIREAYEKLKELLPNVKVFNAETPKVFFIEEEVAVGMNWNGETFKAEKENKDIGYVYPKEGAGIWMDNMVIPAGAENVENAYAFMNFVLRPDVAKMICEGIGYATPNLEAIKLLPDAVRGNRTIYPSDDDLKNSEFQVDVGAAMPVYEKYWEMLKVGR
ncbi:MAG: extracellular solute-binding protein [Syntrophobacteraceae bacterium]